MVGVEKHVTYVNYPQAVVSFELDCHFKNILSILSYLECLVS